MSAIQAKIRKRVMRKQEFVYLMPICKISETTCKVCTQNCKECQTGKNAWSKGVNSSSTFAKRQEGVI